MSIEVCKINKSYQGNQVLHQVSFRCDPGEVMVLLGPSGAGKSTLLRILNLLETSDDGHIRIHDETFRFSDALKEKHAMALRRKVGMVFQQYHLWPHKTVQDNLIEAPMSVLKTGKKEALVQAEQLLQNLQLADKLHAWPAQLSGGQQQRVAIARALMMRPEILLFDEPTAALDPEVTTQVVRIVQDLQQSGITQIIVTHDVSFAKKVASHILYMEQGRIIDQGDHGLFTQPNTEAFANYLAH